MRCTVCTWRGPLEQAEAARPVRPSDVPDAIEDIQDAYEQMHLARALNGGVRPPPCPSCGHHIVEARRASIRPAM